MNALLTEPRTRALLGSDAVFLDDETPFGDFIFDVLTKFSGIHGYRRGSLVRKRPLQFSRH